MMFALQIALTYAAGIAAALLFIKSIIDKEKEAEKRRLRRQAAQKAELDAVGYRIKCEMLRETAMADPLPPKKTISIKAKGTAAVKIAEMLENNKEVVVRRLK